MDPKLEIKLVKPSRHTYIYRPYIQTNIQTNPSLEHAISWLMRAREGSNIVVEEKSWKNIKIVCPRHSLSSNSCAKNRLAWEPFARVRMWREFSHVVVPEPENVFYVFAILYTHLFSAVTMISLTNENTVLLWRYIFAL